MRDPLWQVLVWIGSGLVLGVAHHAHADEKADELFVRRIRPVLHAKCLACHGSDASKIQGGLDLRTHALAVKGGDSGEAVIIPGMPERSPLFLAVSRNDENWSAMPPKEAEALTAEQRESIRQWIEAGASWPDEVRVAAILKDNAERWSSYDGVMVATSGGLSAEWTHRRYKPDGLWAYQPVKMPMLNGPADSAIDELLTRRRAIGLAVAPPATAKVFIRRATFDLTGLPPTPSEVAAFEMDFARDADAAVVRLIDRLLESPHYGERMAQHWLDVVRYADSSGFANDYERGNAWRYRDYVVRAFNNDKPYDDFIREQIAGDELAPDDPEKIIATGFLRMGPWELTGMEVAKVARQRFLDDVTNSVGEVFLAHALQCARCHDHKFDPIPTRDYYSIQAVFATTQIAEREAAFLPTENTNGFEERSYLEKRQTEYQETLAELDEVLLKNAAQWYLTNGKDSHPWRTAVEEAKAKPARGGRRRFSDVFSQTRNALLKQGIAEENFPPKLVGFAPEQFGRERVARKGLERLQWELERYEPFALAVYAGRTPDVKAVMAPMRVPSQRVTVGEMEATCILTGGDPFAAGEKVQPGVLSALTVPTPSFAENIDGRRRMFAEWVAHKSNPLTTRAIVNRLWLWHFNEPLAGNPNNFGSTGKRPTHPELLNWLAASFVERGWSIKSLHRIIMASAAYRRSTTHPDRELLNDKDPAGASYTVFRPRRLSAEELRDAMLAMSGELNRTLGGIPNRPEINLEAALQPRQVMGTFAAAWVPNPLPIQRHRRSLYSLKLRGLTDPMLEVFNAPAPDFSCERREASTVTPQVFSLFNGQSVHRRALAMAQRVINETQSDEAALTRCFHLTFSRSPTAEEIRLCTAHWSEVESTIAATAPPINKLPLTVRRDAVEENTGEKFSFEETLYSNADFVADLQPADVSAHVRALADVCLVLLNSNEFAYVY